MLFQELLHQINRDVLTDVMNKSHIKEAEQEKFHLFVDELFKKTPVRKEGVLHMDEREEDSVMCAGVIIGEESYALDWSAP